MAEIRTYVPQDRPWLVAAHQTYYADAHGFDDTFGALVDEILQAFEPQDAPEPAQGWVAVEDGVPLGSIFCVPAGDGRAKLRLFFLEPAAQGRGLGRRLLETCVAFAKAGGYPGMVLWTHAEHAAACALYSRNGWRCVRSEPVVSFGQPLTEQTWELLF
ncbi:N-acetyltransferase family protein [Pseudaestuariivita sp.]|uniref:N-acetyltransferase family protein n=1 Tax=Pseudaestuariivita sp. TaxID=2211669 RepID=UPI00405816DD